MCSRAIKLPEFTDSFLHASTNKGEDLWNFDMLYQKRLIINIIRLFLIETNNLKPV